MLSDARPLLAALPILAVVPLMLVLQWPAWRAGLAGLMIAGAVALLVFGYGRTVYPDIGVARALAGVSVEALFTAATILWIIVPALSIHQLQIRTGAIETVRGALGRLTDDPRISALVIAWFFALFIEGAAGFGAPVALAAPLLVGLGVPPVTAVATVLIGHSVGVSFGAVGTPVQAQIALTDLSRLELSRATGLFQGPLGWIMLAFATGMIARALPVRGGGPSIWLWAAIAAVAFLAPMTAIATWIGPELPALGGAMVGAAVFLAVLRLFGPRPASSQDGGSPPAAAVMLRAGSPYLAAAVLILMTRLIPQVEHALTAVTWEWSLDNTFGGRFQPLYHPGTMLALAFLIAVIVQRVSLTEAVESVRTAVLQLGGVTVALVTMLALARIMVHSGMIDSMANASANALGGAWPVVAPFVGVLGTFVTGSATASNILFTDFQETAAANAGLPVQTMLAAQGFGAAVGNIVCPHNIIAGGATVGVAGQEGAILRRTLVPCLVYALLGGMLALMLTS
jgi:lactate permease